MPVYKLHIKRTIICGILGLIIAITVASLSPKIYEGRMQILVGASQNNRGTNSLLYPDVDEIMQSGQPKDTASEVDVLRGEGVFSEALGNIYEKQNRKVTKEERDRLYQMYDVVSPKETSVAEVKVRDYDPQTAADLANEIGIVYNQLRKSASKKAVRSAQSYLDRQSSDAKAALEKAHKDVEDYKQSMGIMDPTATSTALLQEEEQVRIQADTAHADLRSADAQVSALQASLAAQPAKAVEQEQSSRNPVINAYESQLADFQSKRDQAAAIYTDDSFQVKQIDEAIAKVKKRLEAEKKIKNVGSGVVTADNPIYVSLKQQLAGATAQRDGLVQRVASLDAALAQKANQVGKLPEIEAKMKNLLTIESLADARYRRITDQAEGLKFKTEGAAEAAQILYQAFPDDEPVAPVFSKMALIGILAGVMMGLLYSYSLEALKLRVYNSTQLTELTGLPVLASVPTLPRPLVRRLQRSLNSPSAAVLEPFRFMAFSTLSSGKDRPRSMLFTGVGGAVGTTTAAAQYAIAAARTGAKVVLVDYDLQYATLSRLFDSNDKPGVRELLARTMLGTGSTEMAIPTHQQNLSLVPAGTDISLRIADVPFDNLCGLIALLEKEADLVVIDAPAIDRISDAARLVPCVDQVCMVVSATATNYRHILVAQDILRRSGAKDIALVLSGASQEEEPFTGETSAFIERA